MNNLVVLYHVGSSDAKSEVKLFGYRNLILDGDYRVQRVNVELATSSALVEKL